MQVDSPVDLMKGLAAGPPHVSAFKKMPPSTGRPNEKGARHYPLWLDRLVETHFFSPCEEHYELKKNECTFFCQDCCTKFCVHCSAKHQGHATIQIRRYVYCDVVRTADVQRFYDTAGIQMYTINSARVCFLHQKASQVVQAHKHPQGAAMPAHPRPDPHHPHGFQPSSCVTCSRAVREGASFCSLVCKLTADNNGTRPLAPPRPATLLQSQPLPWQAALLPPTDTYSSDEDAPLGPAKGPEPPFHSGLGQSSLPGGSLWAPTAVGPARTYHSASQLPALGLATPSHGHAPLTLSHHHSLPFLVSSSLPPSGFFPGIPLVTDPRVTQARLPVPLLHVATNLAPASPLSNAGMGPGHYAAPAESPLTAPNLYPFDPSRPALAVEDEGTEGSAKRICALTLASPSASKRQEFLAHLPHLQTDLGPLPPSAQALLHRPEALALAQLGRRSLDSSAHVYAAAMAARAYGLGLDSASGTAIDRKRKGGSPRRSPLDEAPLAVLSLW